MPLRQYSRKSNNRHLDAATPALSINLARVILNSNIEAQFLFNYLREVMSWGKYPDPLESPTMSDLIWLKCPCCSREKGHLCFCICP